MLSKNKVNCKSTGRKEGKNTFNLFALSQANMATDTRLSRCCKRNLFISSLQCNDVKNIEWTLIKKNTLKEPHHWDKIWLLHHTTTYSNTSHHIVTKNITPTPKTSITSYYTTTHRITSKHHSSHHTTMHPLNRSIHPPITSYHQPPTISHQITTARITLNHIQSHQHFLSNKITKFLLRSRLVIHQSHPHACMHLLFFSFISQFLQLNF